jgi:hypothetical protein
MLAMDAGRTYYHKNYSKLKSEFKEIELSNEEEGVFNFINKLNKED